MPMKSKVEFQKFLDIIQLVWYRKRFINTFYEDDARKYWKKHLWDVSKEPGNSNLTQEEKDETHTTSNT